MATSRPNNDAEAGITVSIDPGEADPGVRSAAIGDVLSRLAQDLQTPLGILSQAVNDLGGGIDPPLTNDQRRTIALAERAIRRVSRVRDLLALVAEIEGGRLAPRLSLLDLGAVVRESVESARALEPRREVAFSCELPDAKCPYMGDREYLSRGLVEITSNAIRHARSHVRVSLGVGDDMAHINVEDDGQGVASAKVPTLFRRFTAGVSQAAAGLGLSIAHDLITAHGGALSLADSTLEPGRGGTRGARFTAAFPLTASMTRR